MILNYSFPNFNHCTIEIQKCLIQFIPHFNGCHYLSMLVLKLTHASKRGPRKSNHRGVSLFHHLEDNWEFSLVTYQDNLKLPVSKAPAGIQISLVVFENRAPLLDRREVGMDFKAGMSWSLCFRNIWLAYLARTNWQLLISLFPNVASYTWKYSIE